MHKHLRALRFFHYIRNAGNLKIGVDSLVLDCDGSKVFADIYLPEIGKQSNRGTIMLVHGMTAYGNRDPRMVALAKAMAGCGYIAVCPHFPDIAEFRIRMRTVDEIGAALDAIADDSGLCRGGMISIFSASFSAGIALIAASRDGTAERVSSICGVGSYSGIESSIEFLLGRRDNDDYGRLIVLKNFVHCLHDYSDSFYRALHEGILDNGLKRDVPVMPEIMKTLPVGEKVELFMLLNDPDYRLNVWRRIMDDSPEARSLCERLCVLNHAHNLRARIVLIHGARDDVIPSSESIQLFNRLKDFQVPSRILLTDLVGHGDLVQGSKLITGLAGLIDAFAFFLDGIDHGARI